MTSHIRRTSMVVRSNCTTWQVTIHIFRNVCRSLILLIYLFVMLSDIDPLRLSIKESLESNEGIPIPEMEKQDSCHNRKVRYCSYWYQQFPSSSSSWSSQKCSCNVYEHQKSNIRGSLLFTICLPISFCLFLNQSSSFGLVITVVLYKTPTLHLVDWQAKVKFVWLRWTSFIKLWFCILSETTLCDVVFHRYIFFSRRILLVVFLQNYQFLG